MFIKITNFFFGFINVLAKVDSRFAEYIIEFSKKYAKYFAVT
jgi:hypothetical protein